MVVLVAVINTISLIRAIQISLSVSSSEFQLHERQMAEGKHRCCGFWTALMAFERQDEEAADVVYDGVGGCLLNKVKMTSFSPYW
eukprot:scaffold1442_cov212-Alexandrium_tamarense.AAC.16